MQPCTCVHVSDTTFIEGREVVDCLYLTNNILNSRKFIGVKVFCVMQKFVLNSIQVPSISNSGNSEKKFIFYTYVYSQEKGFFHAHILLLFHQGDSKEKGFFHEYFFCCFMKGIVMKYYFLFTHQVFCLTD